MVGPYLATSPAGCIALQQMELDLIRLMFSLQVCPMRLGRFPLEAFPQMLNCSNRDELARIAGAQVIYSLEAGQGADAGAEYYSSFHLREEVQEGHLCPELEFRNVIVVRNRRCLQAKPTNENNS